MMREAPPIEEAPEARRRTPQPRCFLSGRGGRSGPKKEEILKVENDGIVHNWDFESEESAAFIAAVSDAYWQSDEDREMLERSLELSSHELLQANSEMQAVFKALPDLFFLLDSEGRILDCKGGSETNFYLSPRELLGKRIQDVPIPEVAHKFDLIIRQLRRTKAKVSLEYAIARQDQQHFFEARLLLLHKNQVI